MTIDWVIEWLMGLIAKQNKGAAPKSCVGVVIFGG